jgi:hypothetical protein
MTSPNLYAEIVGITQEYLGPAAERFVTRQITFHLQKLPHDVAKEDLTQFAESSKVTLSLLTEDEQAVEEYAFKIIALAN